MRSNLSMKERETIRSIRIFRYSDVEWQDKPVTRNGKVVKMLSFPEMVDLVVEKIHKQGFSHIERVHPANANCIIRTYRKLHYECDENIYNLCGANCFTMEKGAKSYGIWLADWYWGKWISYDGLNDFEINHAKYTIRYPMFGDDYVVFNCDFVDYYVCITK